MVLIINGIRIHLFKIPLKKPLINDRKGLSTNHWIT